MMVRTARFYKGKEMSPWEVGGVSMRRWCERSWLCPVAVTVMLLGFIAVGADTVANPVDNASVPLAAAPSDSNDLRWDLAKDFEFRWTAAELSAKVVSGATSNSLERTLTISGELRILDTEGLVTIESDRPRIVKISDGHGNAAPCQFEQGSAARWYDDRGWQWHSGPQGPWGWCPFNLTLRLPDDPNEPVPSSLAALEAYVYVLLADNVISLDIPFDPNGGWHELEAAPDLQICVDPTTPPCPGPLRYVPVAPLPGSSKGFESFPYRPTAPVPLYRYTTWVKSKSGAPVMTLRDTTWHYYRDTYPLGDYAILRTELYDSVRQTSVNVPAQEIGSEVSDVRGTHCWGQMEQGRYDTYDTIRHIIVVHPVEVKIPFVLKNVPIPKP
jgi:hypothetical protein